MATISGRLMYDPYRTTIPSGSLQGIADVPIVLQNTTTKETLAVLTGLTGNYSFTNVPTGNYQIVEYFGYLGAVQTPGDFSDAVIKDLITSGVVPPISYVSNPPLNTTNLDCTSPNTLLINVSDADITNLTILNGPVKYVPIEDIMDKQVIVSDDNLITIAENGTFGSYPSGTPSYTFADSTYVGIGEGFKFINGIPHDGYYAIENITSPTASGYTWWSFADHTTGNETGRSMIINGDNPGGLLFNETVALKPNTYYLFSAWILNMIKRTGYQAPALGVRLLDENGQILVEQTLGQEIPANPYVPEWVQIGSIIYSNNHSSLTVQFLSQGPAAIGNDYALDDVIIKEVSTPAALPVVKSIDKNNAQIGDIVTYTILLKNTYDYEITNVTFKDILPDGLTFVPGTVKIDDIIQSSFDPNNGFSVPNIDSDVTINISFSAQLTSIPSIIPIINKAEMTYDYAYIKGGIPSSYHIYSNEVPLNISDEADLGIIKTALTKNVKVNDFVTYLLTIKNYGPADAQNVIVNDIIPTELSDVTYSLDGGIIWNSWSGTHQVDTLTNGNTFSLLIRGRIIQSNGIFRNTAEVKSDTVDSNPDNNRSSVDISVVSYADLSVVKTACPNVVINGDSITYTIIVSNHGPQEAIDVVLIDKIPEQLSSIRISLDNGRSWHRWDGSIHLGTMAANTNKTILISGKVNPCAKIEIINTVEVSSKTYDYNLHNNKYTITNKIKNHR